MHLRLSKDKTVNRCKSKIASQNGASITFALLIFLVCAVVSAAVLVAGSAAAGRMAGLAETDQRYYSVTSAAQLLSDRLDNKTISMFTVDGTTYRVPMPMNQITEDVLASPKYMVDPENPNPKSMAECLAKAYLNNTVSTAFTITDGAGGTPLDVSAVMKTNDEGDSTFTITNTSGKRHYKVLLTFATDIRRVNPPILKNKDAENERVISDSIEITWHADRMMSSYDDR